MGNNLFYESQNPEMKFIWSNERTATLYSISNSIFMLEKKIKEGACPLIVEISYYCDLSIQDMEEISQLLTKIILDVLCEEVFFEFKRGKISEENAVPSFPKNENICLFSGGIDSTLGILESKKKFGSVLGLYVGHQDTGRITQKVMKMKEGILATNNIPLIKFLAPKMGKDYSQLRGFLYVLYASILSNFVYAKKIIISECGATMYQPKFAPLDTITYTTHPYVLRTSKRISEIILKRNLDLIIPFEDFTKTEMIKMIPFDDILSKTHSCITGRWGQNCGTCYACIARIIGSINNELSFDYFKNKVFDKDEDKILNSILNFCFNFQLNRGIIDFWSFHSIENFGQEELFERVCDDTFLSLKKLERENKLKENYRIILKEYIKKREKELNLREEKLKELKLAPDFNKKVL